MAGCTSCFLHTKCPIKYVVQRFQYNKTYFYISKTYYIHYCILQQVYVIFCKLSTKTYSPEL
ncbi:hypothetical protein CLCAR_2968 [Clostridium carboxidivorans P7]|nr:hypothetical protein CLCAR_2968 [Clostridium carboxidivorans P7]